MGATAVEYDRLIRESIRKKQSSRWYIERLGLPLRRECKGIAGKPKFIDGCEEIEMLYLATVEEVDKVARCYDTIEGLRAAVLPPTIGLVRSHTENMYWRHASVIWSSGLNPMTQPSVKPGTCYDRPLVYSHPQDRQRIQYLLLGWIIHRAYRKLQKKASPEASRNPETVPPEVQASSSRRRTRDVPNYKMSTDSDVGGERWSTSSLSPFVPTDDSSEDVASVVQRLTPRADCTPKNDDATNSNPTKGFQEFEAPTGAWELDNDATQDTYPKCAEQTRTIKRRHTSMPDQLPAQKRTFKKISDDESIEAADCDALLQRFKVRRRTPTSTHQMDSSRKASRHSSHVTSCSSPHVEPVPSFRPPQTYGSRMTHESPFELHATPPSPEELGDEQVIDVVASTRSVERYEDISESGFGGYDRGSSHHEGPKMRSIAIGKSIATQSPEQNEVDRRLLALKMNDILQEGYQQLTSRDFKVVEELIRRRWQADASFLRETFDDAFDTYHTILEDWLKCVDGFVTYNDMTGFFGDKGTRAEYLKNLPGEVRGPARRILLATGLMIAQWRCDPNFTVEAFSRDLARIILNISHWSDSMAPGELEELLSGFNTCLFSWFS